MGLRGVVLAAALAFPATASAGGSPDVAALQVALHARGAFSDTVDGVFGPRTQAAVVRFQRRAGLTADGVAGPRTRRALAPLGGPRLGARTLRRGAVGADVAALQFALGWHGSPSGPFDGRFGPHVEAAVRRFQRGEGLVADGIVGPLTLAALARRSSGLPVALSWPLAGTVTGGFGPRGARFHTGVDLAAPLGAPVATAGPGRVVFAGFRGGGWGLTVVVAHGRGVRTFYAHLSAVRTVLGARVGPGAVVGSVGATGNATGPHLHFEVRVDGLAVDPLPLLSR